jgi:acyl dehydratase
MSERAEITLSVVPAEGVTDAYAAASGDHNPIHLDEAFAASVGLGGRILHGLWTAAQVARAAESAAPDGPVLGSGSEARYALESLSVAFRGMGRIGPEIVVAGTVADTGAGVLELALSATQDGTRLVRNGKARIRRASAAKT